MLGDYTICGCGNKMHYDLDVMEYRCEWCSAKEGVEDVKELNRMDEVEEARD